MNNKFHELAKGLARSVTRRQALKRFGSPATLAVDINDSGQIVEEYVYGTTLGQRAGFLLSNGVFTPIAYPGATFTRALGINRYGDIVGDHQKAGNNNRSGNQFGYLLKKQQAERTRQRRGRPRLSVERRCVHDL